jgi:endonuclease YncB( thermonuclease family)
MAREQRKLAAILFADAVGSSRLMGAAFSRSARRCVHVHLARARKHNRPVAQCYAGDDDLQERMVLAAWAWAYTQYSDRYVPQEKDAMARKVGVHAHRCHPPWEWRALNRRER